MTFTHNDILQVSVAGHTTGQLIAAPEAGRRILVVGFLISLDAAGEFYFENGTSGTDCSGPIEVLADTPVGAFSGMGVLALDESQRLDIESTQACNGWIRYVLARA